MRRLWLVAGAGVGVYGAARLRRATEVFTYDGLTDRLAGLFVGMRLFGDEVRAGAEEKEAELRQRLALTDPARQPLTLVRGNHD